MLTLTDQHQKGHLNFFVVESTYQLVKRGRFKIIFGSNMKGSPGMLFLSPVVSLDEEQQNIKPGSS